MELVHTAHEAPRSGSQVVAQPEDIESLYRLFLGRERERRDEGDDEDNRIGAGIAVVTRGIIFSREFELTVQNPMMAGRLVRGPVFDMVPPDALRAWAAARLPLSPAGCARVTEARDWYDLHTAIFADPDFCHDVLVPGAAAAGLAAPLLPIARQAMQPEDIESLYRLFLGRERERRDEGDDEDNRIGAGIAVVTRGIIFSREFELTVQNPMMAGRLVRGPVFDMVPPDALRAWAAARLPLSPAGCARVTEARDWYDLHTAIFTDPDFCHDVLVPGAAAAGLAAPLLPIARQAMQPEDIESLYRLFLGRERERRDEGDDEDNRIGAGIAVVTRGIIFSREFELTVQNPMMAGRLVRGPVFDMVPPDALRAWAAARLPLSPAGCARVTEARDWYDLHTAIFADPDFCHDVLVPGAAAAGLAAPLLPIARQAMQPEDIESLYRLFLGRERERRDEGDDEDNRIGAGIAVVTRGIIFSREFELTVQNPMMAGRLVRGPVFDMVPPDALRAWAAARLPLSPAGCARVTEARDWYDLHTAIFADPDFCHDVLVPGAAAAGLAAPLLPIARQAMQPEDIESLYRLFLGRERERRDEGDDEDNRIGAGIAVVTRGIIFSREFELTVQNPMMAGRLVRGPVFDMVPPDALRAWAAARLPLSPAGCARVTEARDWYDLHTAIFADPDFCHDVLVPGAAAAGLAAPLLPIARQAMQPEDIESLYRLFLGRERERRDEGDDEDNRIGAGIAVVTRGIIFSREFELTVQNPMMAGRLVRGPVFDMVPPDALRAWAAARLPLSPAGCARVTEARDWYDLHTAIFADPDFCHDVLVPGAAAAGLAAPLLPIARQAMQPEDIESLYRLFLGRERERRDEGDDEDNRIGAGIAVVTRGIIFSREFELTVQNPMMAGRLVRGPVFDMVPPDALRAWAAARLPLSPAGCARVTEARDWYDLHTAIFADPDFCHDVLTNDDSSTRLCGAPVPKARPVAQLEDIAFLYRVFLGREPERENWDGERVGCGLDAVIRDIIHSSEFTQNVYDRMMAGLPIQGQLFETAPAARLRNWVVSRLPLSTEGHARMAKARSWRDLHSAIFADQEFYGEVLAPDVAVAQLVAAPVPRGRPIDLLREDI